MERTSRHWLVAGGLTLALLAAGGVGIYRAEMRQVESLVDRDLMSIAKLKAEQVATWRTDRLGDALVLGQNAALRSLAARVAGRGGEAKKLAEVLEPVARAYGYADVQLVDEAGRAKWSLRGSPAGVHEADRLGLSEALRTGRPAMGELHDGGQRGVRQVAVIAPLGGGNALALEMKAERSLDAVVNSWPYETKTGRAHLVRKGGEGSGEEEEFRAAAEVRGSTWVVEVEVGRGEGLERWRLQPSILLGGLLSLMAAVALGMAVMWQREREAGLRRMLAAEAEQRKAEGEYHRLLDHLPVGVSLRDAEERLSFANGAAGRLAGCGVEELIGRASTLGSGWEFLDEDGQSMDVEEDLLREVARTGQERRDVVLGIKAPGALEPRWLLVNCFPWKDGVLSCSMDITERRKVEEALRMSQDHLRQALDVGEIGIFDHNYATGQVFWSGRLQSLFLAGEGDELSRQLTLERMHPEDRGWVETEMERARRAEGDGHLELEHRLLRPDGTVRWVRVKARYFFEGGTVARVVGAYVDVTAAHAAQEERERLREELAQAQKLESVGRLAGGIAHEFNNLLTVVLGYAEQLQRWLPEGTEPRKWAGEIGRAGARASKLAAQLLAFGRRQMVRRTWVDVNLVVLDGVKILDEMAGGLVRWEAQLEPRLERIQADHDQVFEMVMTLGLNAREAVAEGGRVEVGTAMRRIGTEEAAVHADRKAGDYVVVTVRDNGRGMKPEELERIFEPFYTTKPPGHGTGLSLPSAYGAAKQNGGWIEVESTTGQGTAFRVYLPVAEDGGAGA